MKDLSGILGLKSEPVASGVGGVTLIPIVRDPPERSNIPLHRRVFLSVMFGLTACATATVPGSVPVIYEPVSLARPPSYYDLAVNFVLDAPPKDAFVADLKLWATHYHTPEVKPAPADAELALPLMGRDGSALSPPLSARDWCGAALQGSVAVRSGKTTTAYVYVDSNGPEQANCDEWLGSLSEGVKNATRRARFMKVNHALGCSGRNHPLAPFRTIAVDPAVIPLESVVFVPELRGRAFDYNGEKFTHDGYLFAGDRGGAIRGGHIDVFLTDGGAKPLEDLFASTEKRTFRAHVVREDHAAARAITFSQSARCVPE